MVRAHLKSNGTQDRKILVPDCTLHRNSAAYASGRDDSAQIPREAPADIYESCYGMIPLGRGLRFLVDLARIASTIQYSSMIARPVCGLYDPDRERSPSVSPDRTPERKSRLLYRSHQRACRGMHCGFRKPVPSDHPARWQRPPDDRNQQRMLGS
jgi:hypothetical protein